jgi:hypothetical protein
MSVSFDEDHASVPAAPDQAADTGAFAHRPAVVPSLASLAARAAGVAGPQQAGPHQAPGQAPEQAPGQAPGQGQDPLLAAVPFVPDPADLEASQEQDGPEFGPENRPVPTTRRLPRSTGAHALGGAGIGAGLGSVAGGAIGGALGAVFGGGPLGMLFGGLVGVGAGALLGAGVGALAGAGVGAFRNRKKARLERAQGWDVSPADVGELMQDDDIDVVTAAVQNPNARAEDLGKLLARAGYEATPPKALKVFSEAVCHPNVNPDDIHSLAERTEDIHLLKAIAESDMTSPDTLLAMTQPDHAASSTVPLVMGVLARRSDLPQAGVSNLLDSVETYAEDKASWESLLILLSRHPNAGGEADRARTALRQMNHDSPDYAERKANAIAAGDGRMAPTDRRSAMARDIDSSPLGATGDLDSATTQARALGFQNVDLSDFDLESANEVVSALTKLKERFPTVSGLEYIGSASKHRMPGMKESGENTVAYTAHAGHETAGWRGIAVSDKFAGNAVKSNSQLAGDQRKGWAATGSLSGVMAHEFGHAVQKHLELTNSFDTIREHLMGMHSKGPVSVAREVSGYATVCSDGGDPTGELFAELFADYAMSRSPSRNAMVVGKVAEAALKSEQTDDTFTDPLAQRDAAGRARDAWQ